MWKDGADARLTQEQIAAYLDNLEPISPEEKARLAGMIRRIAKMSRDSVGAQVLIERLLRFVDRELPEETRTFRVYCLDDQHQSARQIGRRLCMETSTVHHHNRRVLEAMLPLVFGIDGIFQDSNKQEAVSGDDVRIMNE